MKKSRLIKAASAIASLALVGTATLALASDHDDGEIDLKGRALNLTDHYAFKTPGSSTEMTLIMYFNPRSLPGRQYSMSTQARYEFHVSKAATKTSAPTVKDDFVFRFEANAPDMTGTQMVTLTVLKDGQVMGTHTGMTTGFAGSKSNTVVANNASVSGNAIKWFIGQRADSFHFDVVRFFQVRTFLAGRFFGGAGGNGDATAGLADNCRGDKFLANLQPGGPTVNEAGGVPDADVINLFNPPSCAPDFTKNLNVTAIVMNVPIAMLGGSIFDTWSTISVPE
ncbi:MAG: DUF4331 family protein [Deltaproteobacteria bacterium]|nr:DUF4331 family protein [Deltaproteobacteria bacterium]